MSLYREAFIFKNSFVLRNQVLTPNMIYIYTQPNVDMSMSLKLQNEISNFKDYLEARFDNIKEQTFKLKFSTRNKDELHNWSIWFQELENTDLRLKEKQSKVFNFFIREIQNRDIDKENFEYINQVIRNQKEIAQEIFEARLSKIEDLETVISYLSEVANYLRFDLELETLPLLNSKVALPIKEHDSMFLESYYELKYA
jgi:hypothetical protein